MIAPELILIIAAALACGCAFAAGFGFGIESERRASRRVLDVDQAEGVHYGE